MSDPMSPPPPDGVVGEGVDGVGELPPPSPALALAPITTIGRGAAAVAKFAATEASGTSGAARLATALLG